MTDAAQTTDTASTPSADTQAAIAAIFNESPNSREMSTVQQVLSPDGQQAPTGATDPNAPASAPAPNGQQMAPAGQGQAVSPADSTQQHPAQVPASRLKEEADRRRAAEQHARTIETQLAQMQGYLQALQQPQQQHQAPAAPVDPNPLPQQFRSEEDFLIADPKGYAQWMRQGAQMAARQEADKAREEFNAQVRELNWQSDDMTAKSTYGAEFVESVKAHVKANPQLSRHFSQFKNPYTKAAEWAREQQMRQAIPNGDVNAAKANWYRDLMANQELQKALGVQIVPINAAAPPPSSVPPSLGSINRSAGHTGAVQNTADAIESLFDSRRAG